MIGASPLAGKTTPRRSGKATTRPPAATRSTVSVTPVAAPRLSSCPVRSRWTWPAPATCGGAGTALARARRSAETTGRVEDELSGPLTCSVDRAGSLWSDAELALGRAGDALALADRAVATFEVTPEEHRNQGSERMARLQHVKAHLVLGDPTAAEDALQPVYWTPLPTNGSDRWCGASPKSTHERRKPTDPETRSPGGSSMPSPTSAATP